MAAEGTRIVEEGWAGDCMPVMEVLELVVVDRLGLGVTGVLYGGDDDDRDVVVELEVDEPEDHMLAERVEVDN